MKYKGKGKLIFAGPDLYGSLLHKHAHAFCDTVFAIGIITGFEAVAEHTGKKIVGPCFETAHKGINDVV